MTTGNRQPVQEYLAVIYSIEEEGEPAIQAHIAKRLERAAPTVAAMLKRLENAGYATRDPESKEVVLTEAGLQQAEEVVRRHRLAECMLVDLLGMEWHTVHREAQRWQYAISDEVACRLVKVLGNPETCPHGNPIPGRSAERRWSRSARLTDLHAGQAARATRITEELQGDQQILESLLLAEFHPGCPVLLLEAGDVVKVSFSGATPVTLPRRVASGICVD